MTPSERIILALDVPSESAALDWARRFRGHVGLFKIGLRLFTAAGPALVTRIASEFGPVFLDLKYHDIPNTVAAAVHAAAKLGASMLSVHASGGMAMLRAASEAASSAVSETGAGPVPAGASGMRTNGSERARAAAGSSLARGPETAPPRRSPSAITGGGIRIVAVTVLTSLGPEDLAATGISRAATDQVLALAEIAWLAGCDGLVASPLELAALRARMGPAPLLITPGIRSAADAPDDQARTASARDAIESGADYIVIGRPVLAAPDPEEALARIVATLARP